MKHLLVSFFLLIAIGSRVAAQGSVQSGSRPSAMRFTENKGQWHEKFLYRTDVPDGKVLIEKNAFWFYLFSPQDMQHVQHPGSLQNVTVHGHSFKEIFVDANPEPLVTAENPSIDYSNYFIGNNAAKWASHVRSFSHVRISNLYNGIDMLVCFDENNQLKYDWLLQPGADVSQIKIKYEGANKIKVANSELLIETTVGTVKEQKPFAYQLVDNVKQEIKCRFVLNENNEVTFVLPKIYNPNLPLVIDPNIVFATYTGSTADNWGYTATYDNQGNMYVGGYVNATGIGLVYPTTTGAFQTTWGGGTGGNNDNGNGIAYACDMGISKFSSDGVQLLYSTYLGGSDNDTPNSLVVDAQNNLVIYGVSYSANYPVTSNAFDNTYNGNGDIVITKLDSSGSALIGSTFMGGDSMDGINYDPHEENPGHLKRNYGDQNRGEVNTDANGNIYVASCTHSNNFPVTSGAAQTNYGGAQDGCVFKLNANCSQLIWGSYLGGSSDDACYSLDLGVNNTLYVAGGTMSNNFPTVSGSLHTSYLGGSYDGFVSLFNNSGTQLLASSYIGTNGNDQVYFVKSDGSKNIYILGQATSQYPVVNAAYSNANSGQFIVKLNPNLNSVFYSTTFGNGNGSPNISPTAFLVDTCENVYVAGWGCTANSVFSNAGFLFPANEMFNMPLTADALQHTTDGTDFYFFVLAKNAQNILYGSYYGGNGAIEHVDGGTSRFDKRGIIYQAICAGCGGNSLTPTTPGVWATTNHSNNCNELGLKIAFNLSGTSVSLNAYPRATGCVPLTVQFNGIIDNALNYQWYFGDGGTANNILNPLHTYTDTGTYRAMLVGIDSNSCNVADTAFVDVWVRDDSLVANFLPKLIDKCDSFFVKLVSVNYPTSTDVWTTGDGQTFTADSLLHYYQTPGTYNITLVVNDTTKCNLADTFNTQFIMPPRGAAYTLSDSLGCPPLTVNFSIPYLNTATYLWNFGDGTFGNSFSVSHTYSTKGNYNISLVVNDTLCHTSDTAYSNILIHQKPLADFLVAADTFRFETPVTFTNNSLYYTHLLWNFGDGTTIADEEKPVHTYENIDWIKVCLVASNDFCEDTACKEIFISYKALIGVPNAFSPNGDGVNDVVKVEGKGIVELTFRIYNRWGEKVFETHDKNEGWNGLYKGVLQEMDVYTYAVEAKLINGDSVPLKGNITLLR